MTERTKKIIMIALVIMILLIGLFILKTQSAPEDTTAAPSVLKPMRDDTVGVKGHTAGGGGGGGYQDTLSNDELMGLDTPAEVTEEECLEYFEHVGNIEKKANPKSSFHKAENKQHMTEMCAAGKMPATLIKCGMGESTRAGILKCASAGTKDIKSSVKAKVDALLKDPGVPR